MEYGVLGPLTAVHDGAARNLGGPRQRMVLAVLLAHVNRVLSQDALIDAVWAGDPPDAATSTLHGYVSHLRRELGGEILREGDGYRVLVAEDSLDATRFERMAAEGRKKLATDPARAVVILQEALGLWYGMPYGDLGGAPALAAEVVRLGELRLAAVESRIEADVAVGNHGAVVGELETLIREHPYRERLRALQMLALYRSGRQAEALRAYQRTRTLLGEELGIEPSLELRDLEQRILEQDPGLDVAIERQARTLAFLFTDIENSTVLWELHPEEMPAALEQHDRLLAEIVAEQGGRVFKHTGDGVRAVFPDVAAATAAARRVQQSMAEVGTTPSFKVSAAIDIGDVEESDGDYFGNVLNRAARLVASSHGHQVLVSAEASAALAGTEPKGSVTSLGEHRFRGLGRPMEVFQLLVDGTPCDFPPLRTTFAPAEAALVPEETHRSVRGYELREQIGEGDFGIVYRAFQPSVGREVAVKVIRPEYVNRPDFVRRFEAEGHLVAEFEHPHIVPLFDYWREPGGAYLVMPYMRGGNLSEALRRGPWNLAPALRLLEEVGGALGYAHRRGVIHRDIKSGNVLLDAEGNAYLSDFGMATRVTDAVGAPTTTSLAYIPPEEARGEPLTPRADIFSLGVLAFLVLTGVNPGSRRPLPSLAEARPGLPAELGGVLRRATDDQPGNRHDKVEDFLRAVRQAVGADVVAVAEPADATRSVAPARNPYKGLRPFIEADALDFHGRDSLIDELLQAVSAHPLVAVVGPSGSGKSSVVRAGLVPALRSGGLPGSRGWLVTDMYPGSYPFEELEAALLRVAVERPPGLIDELSSDERGLLRVTKQILPPDESQLLLVIDQFEEVFSAVASDETRQLFLDSLATVAADERCRVRVVVTMRADFFDRPLEDPRFGDLVTAGLITVSPPSEEGLAQAIAAPARSVGVDLEPGLVGEIIRDVEGQPGALPLLQYALTELFNRRESNLLTIDGYYSTGGVRGALGRRAEELFGELTLEGKEVARQLFLRLVTVDELSGDTRRRVRQTELKSLAVDQSALDTVLRQFASFRLLSYDRDPVTRGPTVEVAHEALLREWDRLTGWIDAERENLLIHRRISSTEREWADSGGDPSFLLRGGRLEQAERWAQDSDIAPSTEEAEYLAASRELRETETKEASRRRRLVVGLLAGGLVVAILLGLVAFWQWGLAQASARQTQVHALAAASEAALDQDPELAILLALEAAEMSQRAGEELSAETVAALQAGVQDWRLEMRIDGGPWEVEISVDGSLLATNTMAEDESSSDNRLFTDVAIWDPVSGERLRTLVGPSRVTSVEFSPTDRRLAVGYRAREGEAATVLIWDPDTGEQLARMIAPGRGAALHWSPDGALLVGIGLRRAVLEDRPVTVWDTAFMAEVSSFVLPGVTWESARFLDETTLAVAKPGAIPRGDAPGHAPRVGYYDVTSGEELEHPELVGIRPDDHFSVLGVDAEAGRLVLGGDHETGCEVCLDSDLRVWDLDTGSVLWSAEFSDESFEVDPDRGWVAVYGHGAVVRVLDLDDGSELMTLAGHTGAITDVAFDPRRDRLYSTALDGETLVWDVAPTGPSGTRVIPIGSAEPYAMVVSPDGTEVAVMRDDALTRYDLGGGAPLLSVEGSMNWRLPAPVSPDWRLVAMVESGFTPGVGEALPEGWVRDLITGEKLHPLPACVWPKGFSSDGSMLALDGQNLIIDQGVVQCSPRQAPGGIDHRSRVVDPVTGEVLLDLGGRGLAGPTAAVFNPAGVFEPDRYLAILEDYDTVELHDMVTGRQVATVDTGEQPYVMAFDPSGRYLAVGGGNSDVWVVDVKALVEGASVEEAMLMFDEVGSDGIWVALGRDGLLATAAYPHVLMWDIHTGGLIRELAVAPSRQVPSNVAFTPDGDLLYIEGSEDQGYGVHTFITDPDRLVELARTRVTRDLSEDECERYLPENNPVVCP